MALVSGKEPASPDSQWEVKTDAHTRRIVIPSIAARVLEPEANNELFGFLPHCSEHF
jgi:hypothetical protein